MTEKKPRRHWLIAVVSAAGLLMAGNFILARALGGAPLFCSAQSDCGIVHATKYATFLGAPTAAWGFGLYAVVGGLALLGLPGWRWLAAFLLSVVGLCASAYLVYLATFVVGTRCHYCVVSLAIAGILCAVLFARRPSALVPGSTVMALAAVTAVLTVGFATIVFGLARPR